MEQHIFEDNTINFNNIQSSEEKHKEDVTTKWVWEGFEFFLSNSLSFRNLSGVCWEK